MFEAEISTFQSSATHLMLMEVHVRGQGLGTDASLRLGRTDRAPGLWASGEIVGLDTGLQPTDSSTISDG